MPPDDIEAPETTRPVFVVKDGDEDDGGERAVAPADDAAHAAQSAAADLAHNASGEDALLDCLVFLSQFHGNPKSPEVLKAGLPFGGPYMTPSLFVRAADRIGFKARIVKRRLTKISKLVLPAVLILEDGRACVMTEFSGRRKAKIMLPETGGGIETPTLKELATDYTGYAIFLRPEFEFRAAQEDTSIKKPSSWFWGTMRQNWWAYLQVVLAAILINIFALTSPLFIMTVYDRVVPNNAMETLYVLAFGAATVFLFDFVLKQLRGYFIDTAGKRADVILASRIFEQVLDMRMASRPGSSGAFANTLREFESLRDFFTSASLVAFIDLPFVLFFIFIIYLIGGPIFWIHATAVPLVLGVGLMLQWPLNSIVRRNMRESEQKHGVLVESISGLETLKSLSGEARVRQKWESYVGLTAQSSLRARVVSQGGVHFATLVSQMVSVAVVIYGVFLIGDGLITVGALIACVILSGRALAPLVQAASLLTRMHRSMSSLSALNEIMRAPVERPVNKNFLHRPKLSGGVAFQSVEFTYPGGDVPALRGVSFEIKPGERVGMIGRVGSGKSTVAKLILGLFEPSGGTVLVDGTDLRQVDPVDLRRSIAYVPQDVYLFRGSVRDNITLAAPQADDADVLTAATLAGVDDFVSQHPMGYDMQIGERGEGLSGGQRQAVAIARAMIHDPPLILLDEPTSSMDTRGEQALKTRLGTILEDRTLVLVTHRASLLTMVDRLLVFDRGRVIADGPTKSVMDALAGGKLVGPKD